MVDLPSFCLLATTNSFFTFRAPLRIDSILALLLCQNISQLGSDGKKGNEVRRAFDEKILIMSKS